MRVTVKDFYSNATSHLTHVVNTFQEKKEEEMAAKQPSTIPGYFDPASINIYFPTTANGQDQKPLNFNM